MSLVIAMRYSGGIMYAADSAITDDDGVREKAEGSGSQKVWCAGGYYMGGAGDVRAVQVAHYNPIMLKGLNISTIVTSFIPQLASTFIHNGCMEDVKPYNPPNCAFLLFDNRKIFVIDNSFAVLEKNNVGIVGICAREAYAVLQQKIGIRNYETLEYSEARSILEDVFEYCERNCIYVARPFYIDTINYDIGENR